MSKLGKSTDRYQSLIRSEDGRDTSARQISGHSLHAFSGKCTETSNLTHFNKCNYAKIRKSNRLWPKSSQFWRWLGYINMPNFRPFLQYILQKMLGNLSGGQMDGRWFVPIRLCKRGQLGTQTSTTHPTTHPGALCNIGYLFKMHLKPQSHWACDHDTTYIQPQNKTNRR